MLEILLNPFYATFIFLIIIISTLILLDEEGAFKNFLHFGPSEDAKFINIKLNTWPKVILVYFISFVTALLQIYFNNVIVGSFIRGRLMNPAFKKMDIDKYKASIIIYLYPICLWLLTIVIFFVTLTMKLQFLIPYLFGSLIVNYIYNFDLLEKKKF